MPKPMTGFTGRKTGVAALFILLILKNLFIASASFGFWDSLYEGAQRKSNGERKTRDPIGPGTSRRPDVDTSTFFTGPAVTISTRCMPT
jgi:hypothetical protein